MSSFVPLKQGSRFGRTCDLISLWSDEQKSQGALVRPDIREKKKKYPRLRNSVVQQKTPTLGLYRGLNQSEIVKGGPPPSDWPWSRYSCMCVCALTNASRVLLQSDREKEVSSRDACSVANLATFSAFVDPHSNFLFSQKSN